MTVKSQHYNIYSSASVPQQARQQEGQAGLRGQRGLCAALRLRVAGDVMCRKYFCGNIF